MKRALLCGVAAAVLAYAVSPALAADLNFTSPISQSDFRSLSKQAGSLLSYKNMAPPEPLGLTGFDIGLEVSAISIDKNSIYWSSAFNNDAPAYLAVPKLRVRKGLPLGIDIGAMYSFVPDSNIKLYGFEVSKAILDGTAATPALGIRATYSKLAGVDDLGLHTYGADASVSKGFLIFTPYAGAGIMKVESSAKRYLQAIGLRDESFTVPRFFGGLVIAPLPLLAITGEFEYADQAVYSLKAAITF